MAIATPLKPVVVEPHVVRLDLTAREASALRLVLGLIAGLPQTTKRGFTDAIKVALDETEVELDWNEDDAKGRIEFLR
jgi:hypothetical protein